MKKKRKSSTYYYAQSGGFDKTGLFFYYYYIFFMSGGVHGSWMTQHFLVVFLSPYFKFFLEQRNFSRDIRRNIQSIKKTSFVISLQKNLFPSRPHFRGSFGALERSYLIHLM
jgi:hypothetical protein